MNGKPLVEVVLVGTNNGELEVAHVLQRFLGLLVELKVRRSCGRAALLRHPVSLSLKGRARA